MPLEFESNDEQSPLLGGSRSRPDDDDDVAQAEDSLPPASRAIPRSRRLLVVALSIALIVLLEVGGALTTTPMYELRERIICDDIHGPHPATTTRANDDPCKDEAVQGELSFITGWEVTLGLLPGFLVGVPFGAVADRLGRTLVLGLSLLGIVLSTAFTALVCALPGILPVRLVWLGSVFMLLGGGVPVFAAMIYTMVADVSTDAQRSTTFFWLGSAFMGGALVSNPITYLAMKQSLWFSIVAGIVCLVFTTVLGFCIPETLDLKAAIETSPSPNAHRPADRQSSAETTVLRRWSDQAKTALRQTASSAHWLFIEQRQVGLLLLSVMLEIFGRNAWILLLQYITKRFDLSWSEAGLLLSVQAFFNLVLLIALLPLTSHLLLTKWGVSARAKDLRLAQASAVLAATGTLFIALADTTALLVVGIAISALGCGYTFLLRAFMTSLVGGHEIGLLYTSIAIVETGATLVGGPTFAALFHVGLTWGDVWVGLPFLFGGLVLVGAAVLVGVIKSSPEGEAKPPGGNGDANGRAVLQ